MRWKNWMFGSFEMNSIAAELGRAVLRVGTGLALAFGHGIRKVPPSEGFIGRAGEMGFPVPEFFAWMSGFAEFFCGLLLAIGLFTRPAALLISLNMLVVVFIAHAGDPFGDKEKGLLFLLIAVFFLLSGAGRIAADRWFRREPTLTTRI